MTRGTKWAANIWLWNAPAFGPGASASRLGQGVVSESASATARTLAAHSGGSLRGVENTADQAMVKAGHAPRRHKSASRKQQLGSMSEVGEEGRDYHITASGETVHRSQRDVEATVRVKFENKLEAGRTVELCWEQPDSDASVVVSTLSSGHAHIVESVVGHRWIVKEPSRGNPHLLTWDAPYAAGMLTVTIDGQNLGGNECPADAHEV